MPLELRARPAPFGGVMSTIGSRKSLIADKDTNAPKNRSPNTRMTVATACK
ncbi:hypothetical protein [Oricola sp.]|uniref:hypothetical protein n=1 Tax=Oricola sp. TaxID=1979950 RepID=UPI0025E8D8CE|nr:hypothetical protein [Oricola sp.]MCI5076866.1 hypothetical protein [Oricola sp.]